MGETEHHKRVVVVGAGFGGLNAAKRLYGHGLDILLVDRNNYHLFVPLLYQVTTLLPCSTGAMTMCVSTRLYA